MSSTARYGCEMNLTLHLPPSLQLKLPIISDFSKLGIDHLNVLLDCFTGFVWFGLGSNRHCSLEDQIITVLPTFVFRRWVECRRLPECIFFDLDRIVGSIACFKTTLIFSDISYSHKIITHETRTSTSWQLLPRQTQRWIPTAKGWTWIYSSKPCSMCVRAAPCSAHALCALDVEDVF